MWFVTHELSSYMSTVEMRRVNELWERILRIYSNNIFGRQ